MSDVPISGFPDPIGSSPSEARREAMGTSSTGAGRVGQSLTGAGSPRSSAAQVISETAQGIKDLTKDVDNFVSRSGKKFADTLQRAAETLERAKSASKGLGDVLGSVASSMLPYASEAKAQADKAHAGTKAANPNANNPHLPGSLQAGMGSAAQAAGQVANGGHRTSPGGGSNLTINAQNVTVNGGGGGGVGGSGGTGGNAGDKPNGGVASFLGRAAGYSTLLGMGAAVRGLGNIYNEVGGTLRPQQTAFQRGGMGTIGAQTSMLRSYLSSGVSYFGQEDLTEAMNIGYGTLGGTNFRPTNLAPLQRASLDMSMTEAAQVAQGAMDPRFRNRLYQYGISTKGMSYDQSLLAAAAFSVGKRPGDALTQQDYNRLSTVGETGFSNLEFLTGGNQQVMQATRDLVGQEAGITGLSAANPTLRGVVDRDTARSNMINEMKEEIAGVLERQYDLQERLYDRTASMDSSLQSIAATIGALSGIIQGGLGSIGLAGVGAGAVRWARNRGSRGTSGPSRSRRRSPSRSTRNTPRARRPRIRGGRGVGGFFGAVIGAVGLGYLQNRAEEEAEERAPGTIDTMIEQEDAHATNAGRGFGAPSGATLDDMDFGGVLDIGDPPEGSAIRTDKPASHVTGMHSALRSALERMFRDNPKLHLNSGYRSPAHQARLWNDALKKYGSAAAARKWVAPPGRSKHNSGLAADIGPPSERDWLRRNAGRYGLYLPMTHEPWHVEVKGSRSGKEIVDTNIASAGIAAKDDSAGRKQSEGSMFGNLFGGAFGVTDSEGSVIAALLGGGGGLGGGGSSDSPAEQADKAMRNSADGTFVSGDGSFSGSMAEKAKSVAQAARSAGFSGSALTMAVAIALGESSGNPRAHNPNANTGDNSYGLWQINMLGAMGPARRERFGLRSNEELFDPNTNAKAAYALYQSRGGFGDWSVYKSGAYQQYMDEARAGVNSIGDPATPGDGIDGAPRGGSVVMKGGNKSVTMIINGQQDPEGLARRVMRILNEQDDFEMVGQS